MSPSSISNIHCKVETTAKLLGIKGSPSDRKKIADSLCSQFSQLIIDTFEKKEKAGLEPVVTKSEIKSFFKKLAPNVNIEIMSHNPTQTSAGAVKTLLSGANKSIKGYNFEIPLESTVKGELIRKCSPDDLDTLGHEAVHLFNFITEPKYLTQFAKDGASSMKEQNCLNFYNKILYADELNSSANLSQTKTHLMADKTARGNLLKEGIVNFFNCLALSPEEKIKTLQNWRHSLKSENFAYKDAYTNSTTGALGLKDLSRKLASGEDLKINFQDALGNIISVDTTKHSILNDKIGEVKAALNKSSQSLCSAVIDNAYFFPEKIKIVEKTLADEIGKIRAEQKSLLGIN